MKIEQCNLREVLTCEESTVVLDVAKLLRDKKEKHIVVLKSGNPIGIISTTDISNRLVAEGKDSRKVKAKEIMTTPIMVRESSEMLPKVVLEMLKSDVFSCLITEKGKIKGILDLREAMNKLAKIKIDSGK